MAFNLKNVDNYICQVKLEKETAIIKLLLSLCLWC